MQLKKKHWVLIIVGVLVAGAIVYGAVANKPKIEYTTAAVTRGNLVQTVSETGTITPAKEIELNFATSGQLSKLNVKIGDQVNIDQALGEIDSSGLMIRQQEAAASVSVSQANATQAQANYDSARREYDKLSATLNETLRQAEKTKHDLEDRGAGTVTTYEQAIATAQTSLATTKTTYKNAIANKFDSLETTIDNKLANATSGLDAINRLLLDDDLKQTFSVKNSAVLSQLRAAYPAARDSVTQANAAVAVEKSNRTEINLLSSQTAAQNALTKTFTSLNLAFSALENTVTSGVLTQAELDAYKATIDGQITSISAASTALQSAMQSYNDAKIAYDTNVLSAEQSVNQAQASYDNAVLSARNAVNTARSNRDQQLATAQTRIDSAAGTVAVTRAQVSQAQANFSLIQNQLADNILKSPIKGLVTKINYEIGEQVTPSKALLSVLTENNFQIEVDISETDIAKVKLTNDAEITLDALGPDVKFSGKVYFIEPAATVIQGVTYYKVKVSFDPGPESAVKPGMTASAVILTASRENALMMPARAVVEQNGKTIVRILENETVRESEVNIGLSGDNGLVEVLSGVKENDQVVTFVKDPAKK